MAKTSRPEWHESMCSGWELVEYHDGGDTCRIETPGGWLYRCREWTAEAGRAVSLAFVPDPEKILDES